VSGTSADAQRLDVARELGVHAVLAADQADVVADIRWLGGGLGADVVFECSGAASAARTGLDAVRKGGTYMQVGLFGHAIELDLDQVALKELRVLGVFSSNWRGWHRGLRLAAQGRVKLGPIVSHVLPLAEWERGFEIAEHKQGLKVVLVPESV
jgi:L-iditol 2-dehydrogenase